jgi:hypothetical protein
MSLFDVQLHLFFRLVKLAGLPSGLQFADDLLEQFHDLQALLALVTLDVNLDIAVRGNSDIKLALRHIRVLVA